MQIRKPMKMYATTHKSAETISHTADPSLRHTPWEETPAHSRAAIRKEKYHNKVHLAHLQVFP